jgi:hypothetical protein
MNSPVSCLRDPIQNMPARKVAPPRKSQQKAVIVRNPGRSAAETMLTAPAAYGAQIGAKKLLPIMAGQGDTLIVQNYELVHNVTGSAGVYTYGGDVCNPGLGTNYPWLANIAQNYAKFRWRALRYIYVPACSTATAGSEAFLFSYDPYDAGPATLQDVAASTNSSIGNVWFGGAITPELAFKKTLTAQESVFVDYDPKKSSQPWYYVRRAQSGVSITTSGALTGVPTGGIGTLALTPATFNDPSARPATIYYATTGAGSALNGYIFASYVCEFSEPISSADNL